jgi:hypothetical protein
MKKFIQSIVFAVVVICWTDAKAQHISTPRVTQIPSSVLGSLRSKFAQPQIQMWTKSKVGNLFLYDIEFTEHGEQREARIRQDGIIEDWEKEIAYNNLTAAVQKAIEQKYPNYRFEEIMQRMIVKNGKDEPDIYLIVLSTADKKDIEVRVSLNGTIIDDPKNR